MLVCRGHSAFICLVLLVHPCCCAVQRQSRVTLAWCHRWACSRYSDQIYSTTGDSISPGWTVFYLNTKLQNVPQSWKVLNYWGPWSKQSHHQKPLCLCCDQRLLNAVRKHATRGDPQSVISAIDHFCRHSEWAMNIGDEKGQSTAFVFLDSLLLFFIAQKCSGENLKEISDYFLKITFEYVCFKIGKWVLLIMSFLLLN